MNHPTVIVTGASKGIGAAAARHLARLGANLVLMARSRDRLQEVARECETRGVNAWAVAGDISREEDCERAVREAVEQFGRIDALVNNSGTVEPIGMIRDASAGMWQQSWAVNVLGPVMLIQKSLPYLRRQNGRIINLTSGSVKTAIGGWGAYSSAKAALNKITQVLAGEEPSVAAAGLEPGIVDTDMQATIRARGKSRMAEQNYRWLTRLHEEGLMNPPEIPALAIACLALAMPPDWSGQILQWDEARVQALVESTASFGEDEG